MKYLFLLLLVACTQQPPAKCPNRNENIHNSFSLCAELCKGVDEKYKVVDINDDGEMGACHCQ